MEENKVVSVVGEGKVLRFGDYEIPLDAGVNVDEAHKAFIDIMPSAVNTSPHMTETGDVELRTASADKGR